VIHYSFLLLSSNLKLNSQGHSQLPWIANLVPLLTLEDMSGHIVDAWDARDSLFPIEHASNFPPKGDVLSDAILASASTIAAAVTDLAD
jgi:hypothetical protein